MNRTISAVSVSALLLAGCATAAPPPPLPFGLSAGDVATGFIMAVESCTSAAETGRTLGQLSSYRIIPDSTRGAARAPKPGYKAWAPSLGMGVVEIEEGPGACDVSAYGAVVENTLNVVAVPPLTKKTLLAMVLNTMAMLPPVPGLIPLDGTTPLLSTVIVQSVLNCAPLI